MAYTVAEEAFASLREEWQGLLAEAAINNVFLTPQWQGVWWQEFGRERRRHILAVRHHGRLVGVVPLMEDGDGLAFVGSDDLCDYCDLIVARGEEEPVLRATLDALGDLSWRRLRLWGVHSPSPTLSLLPAMAEALGHEVSITPEAVCPGIDLPPSWEQYVASLTKKDRHELRRKMRRLTDNYQARYYPVTPGEGLAQDLEDFFRLYRHRPDKGHFLTPPREGFFRAIVAATAEAGYLRLFFLEVGGVRVAATLGFDYEGVVYLYNSGFDPAYSPLSVGLLLKAFCIKEAIAWGRRRFDLLRGPESYKYDLGARDVAVFTCVVERRP